MDLRQLACFVAVAEELNFSRAASRMHISQPPLSRQIANLEGELRVRLLERSPQSVSLTAAGRGFLPEARRILALAAKAPEAARRAQRGETGALRIGFVGSTIYTSVPALVGRFRQAYPQVDVTLSSNGASAILTGLFVSWSAGTVAVETVEVPLTVWIDAFSPCVRPSWLATSRDTAVRSAPVSTRKR